MPNTHELLISVEADIAALGMLIKDATTQLNESLRSEFLAKGGCDRCKGYGLIVTWDTLDFMDGSAADFGVCPESECTTDTRRSSGIDVTWHSKHTRWMQVPKGSRVDNTAFKLIVGPLRERYDNLVRVRDDLQRDPRKGERVVILKGKRVTKGFEGTLFWAKDTEWGLRIGVKDDAGEVQWTYIKNVARVIP